MSAYIEVEIRCDGGVGPFDCEPAHYARTATAGRKELREAGWLVSQPGGKDYCPKHRDAAKGGER